MNQPPRALELETQMLFPDAKSKAMAEEYTQYWKALARHAKYGSTVEAVRTHDGPPMVGGKWPKDSQSDRFWGTSEELESVRNFFSMLHHPPGSEFHRAVARASLEGKTAGICLVLARAFDGLQLKTQKQRPARPSLNLVAFVCEQVFAANQLAQRGQPARYAPPRLPANAKQIEVIWRQFRSVAHYWAVLVRNPSPNLFMPLAPGFLELAPMDYLLTYSSVYADARAAAFGGSARTQAVASDLTQRPHPDEDEYWKNLLRDHVPKYAVSGH
jgi:hypothetical protein